MPRAWTRTLLLLLALAAGGALLLVASLLHDLAWPDFGRRAAAPTATPSMTAAVAAPPLAASAPVTATAGVTPGLPTKSRPDGRALAPPGSIASRELVSTAPAVPPAASWPDGPARAAALSADGRIVALTTRAGNLDPVRPDANGYDDLYLYHRSTGRLILVSRGQDGAAANGGSGAPAITVDGSVVAFYSWASNLVADDTNAVQDAFVYDVAAQRLERVSLSSAGVQANDRAGEASGTLRPALSLDGRFVAFQAIAANLVPGDSNGVADVFVHDRQTGETVRVSVGPNGEQANGPSTRPVLSADGRVVVFQSTATNLDPDLPVPTGASQVYLHDRASGRTRLLSRGVDGRPGDADSTDPALSGDGRVVVFASTARNLVVGDTNRAADIFLLDRERGRLSRVSVSSAGTQANRPAEVPTVSLDGRYVAFVSAATNLVNGDTNTMADLFLHDRLAQHTTRLSVAVTGPWTGQEANGPSQGPAALTADGAQVAFVSGASNLAPGDDNGVADLFIHRRVDPPLYALAGRVLDAAYTPLAGVEMAAGPQRTTTVADGTYRFAYLVGGTYTVAAAKPGYSFSPPRRTLSLLAELAGQDFVGFPSGDPSAFLDLPFAYDGRPMTFLRLLRDTDEGGLVDSWFDHDTPDYRKNDAVLLWDGRPRTLDRYDDVLGCFERRCYDGHDGIDFPYRDPFPATPGNEPISVRPAAAGLVAAVVDGCTGGADGGRTCNHGYGNEVILYHDNGYFTRYGHLDTVLVGDEPAWVGPETALGVMGATGNSYGVHLHFAVHQDNGNGRWDGAELDRPVDPFGWAGMQTDPWAAAAGAASRRLWRYSLTAEVTLFGTQGATLRDGAGSVTANVPAGAFAGQVRVELTMGATASPPLPPRRSLGRSFSLRVLDWLQSIPVSTDALARPVELAVLYTGADTRHLALDQVGLYRWEPGARTWTPLPTAVDTAGQVAYAATDRLGEFDLQAPLRCPAGRLEPDDGYDAAVFVSAGHPPLSRLLDGATDEDWLRLDAAASNRYQVTVDEVGEGVTLRVEVYGRDGLTRLAAAGAGTLAWDTSEEGTYFVRVAPAPGSVTGCDAGYRVAVSLAE
jgi:murein DD-endopeptidase MepM/ murein hydrolase activator NlpD/Tol biopolymer transport system component